MRAWRAAPLRSSPIAAVPQAHDAAHRRIIYTESARKVSYFVETADRLRLPLIYLQDVSGFMVGPDAEASGSSAPAPKWWSPCPAPTCPKSCSHSITPAARLLCHGGQGFDPNFTFSWPSARIGVMEGDSAIQPCIQWSWKSTKRGSFVAGRTEGVDRPHPRRYDRWLDARYAAREATWTQ